MKWHRVSKSMPNPGTNVLLKFEWNRDFNELDEGYQFGYYLDGKFECRCCDEHFEDHPPKFWANISELDKL